MIYNQPLSNTNNKQDQRWTNHLEFLMKPQNHALLLIFAACLVYIVAYKPSYDRYSIEFGSAKSSASPRFLQEDEIEETDQAIPDDLRNKFIQAKAYEKSF